MAGEWWFGDKVEKQLSKRAWHLVEFAANRIVEDAKNFCPVDTGALRNSIYQTTSDQSRTITIHVDMYYAAYVEYGTSRNVAQPFLRPAIAMCHSDLVIANAQVDTELGGRPDFSEVNPANVF